MQTKFSITKNSFDGQSWPNRYKLIKEFLKPQSSILELGSGHGELQKYLGNDFFTQYTKVDKFDFEDTITADLNSLDYPIFEERFNYVICSGLLEYLFQPKYCLEQMKQYADNAIVTYYFSKNKLNFGLNHLSIQEFNKMVISAKWKIVDKKLTPDINQFVYLLKRND